MIKNNEDIYWNLSGKTLQRFDGWFSKHSDHLKDADVDQPLSELFATKTDFEKFIDSVEALREPDAGRLKASLIKAYDEGLTLGDLLSRYQDYGESS
ncbi:hypothetical protein E2H86_19640 [Pseudomonas putida]|uniref:hypothetical protein n=1 Tax=Pseudomonas putida group TaxID=136845 RepID=UPI00105980B9|nr:MULTISPECIES: hypothetical protein [Pseudomonas putida group]MBF8748050.1 hypothetical protein [Pseudomonas monteilii]TDJ74794.1 hypothetical protein E2H86_19640 [Pseudomonas putida]